MSKVTILGTGAMGSLMATTLLNGGHKVTVWNRDANKLSSLVDKGAKPAPSPRMAVKEADYVISMVRDDEASRNVWLEKDTGALAGMSENTVAIESSTLTVEWVKTLATHFQKQGVEFLDAPVAGGCIQAKTAQLVFFVGGETSVFEQAKPLLLTMGRMAHYTGSSGSGAAVKLMGNALFGIQQTAMAELLAFIRQSGFDETKAIEALASTLFFSPAIKIASEAMIKGNFAPMFPIDLVAKDFNYVLQTATSSSANMPMTESALKIFAKAVEEGYGQDNITGVAQLYK